MYLPVEPMLKRFLHVECLRQSFFAVAVRPLFPTCRSTLLVVSHSLIQPCGIQLSNHAPSHARASFLGEHQVGCQCVMALCLIADCMSCDRRAEGHCRCEEGCQLSRKSNWKCSTTRVHEKSSIVVSIERGSFNNTVLLGKHFQSLHVCIPANLLYKDPLDDSPKLLKHPRQAFVY